MKKWLCVVLLSTISSMAIVSCAADAPQIETRGAAKIITWPRQTSDELFVARETLQPFYIMAFARGEKIEGATKIEVSVPENWQVWRGSDAPKLGVLPATQAQTLAFDVTPRATKDSADSKDYSAALSAANVLLVARATPSAQAGSTLGLRWLRGNETIAERKVALVPVDLPSSKISSNGKTDVAMWMNDPKFNAQNRDALRELKINVWISQWWGFREYLPTAPPQEAVSTMKGGTTNSRRWSPTYIADGGAASQAAFEKAIGEKIAGWPAAVFPGGKLEEKWIDFRNDHSEAYIHWFRKIIRERAPGLQLSVSTSGATGTSADMNRRLAATDITQLSRTADAVFPQLYSWTSELPKQLDRFNEKLELGRTTLAGTQNKTYPLVGSLAGGRIALAQPKYLRTQILDWWFHGADGFGVWQYFYGVDGRYMQMTSELSALFQEAGEQPKGAMTEKLLDIPPINDLQILHRRSSDGKTIFIGLFNYGDKQITVPLRNQFKSKLFSDKQLPATATIAPWLALVIKVSAAG